MLSRGLQSLFHDIPSTLTAMFIFLTVFLAVTVYVFWRRGAASYYGKLAQIPFSVEEETQNGK